MVRRSEWAGWGMFVGGWYGMPAWESSGGHLRAKSKGTDRSGRNHQKLARQNEARPPHPNADTRAMSGVR